jgi:biopolymer transport protein ExbD
MAAETHYAPADDVMSEINMTPLVDVMLVLLVIFIITLPAVQHAVKVELPRASSNQDAASTLKLPLTVDAQGRYFLGREPMSPDALASKLRELASQTPQPQLAIHGDKQVAYAHVAWAMAAAQRAGLTRIGFVTESVRP